MANAVIGFIGVIAGALLGGLLSLYVDRQKQRRAAWVAARLMASELDVVVGRMRSAAIGADWWAGDLPTDAWRGQLANLAYDTAHLAKVVAAYTIVDRWNSGLKSQRRLDSNRNELNEEANAIATVADLLRTPPRSRLGLASSRALILFIPAALVVFAGFIPQVDLNSTSLAAALEAKTGDDAYFECTPSIDEWLCTEHHLDRPRGACGIGSRPLSRSGLALGLVTIASAAIAPCSKVAPDTKWHASRAGDKVVATPD